MIHYQLCCAADHGFDGWFRDSAAFDAQAQAGLVACPACGTTTVRRALMAPPVRTSRRPRPVQQPAPGPEAQSAPPAAAETRVSGVEMPAQVRAMLQRLRAEVERTCEHVGDRFAAEARAIHDGKAEARAIYGETTPEQAESLAEDGVEVARIPWLPRADG